MSISSPRWDESPDTPKGQPKTGQTIESTKIESSSGCWDVFKVPTLEDSSRKKLNLISISLSPWKLRNRCWLLNASSLLVVSPIAKLLCVFAQFKNGEEASDVAGEWSRPHRNQICTGKYWRFVFLLFLYFRYDDINWLLFLIDLQLHIWLVFGSSCLLKQWRHL